MSGEIERLERWHELHAEALDRGLDYELAALHADYPPSPTMQFYQEFAAFMYAPDEGASDSPVGEGERTE